MLLKLIPYYAFITAAVVCGKANASSLEWQKTTWNNEPAWVAQNGAQEAIVSEARSRVIYIGPASGDHNLLSAPVPKAAPTPKIFAPNWGGHRFWLGPQSRWGWPPNTDWEFSAAQNVAMKGSELVITEVHHDLRYPSIQRVYVWEGEHLRCTARWRGGDKPYYGMHVVAIDVPAEIAPRLASWERVPFGLVAVRGDNSNATDPLPHPAITLKDGRAIAKSGIAVGKFGFYPQTLSVRRGAWTLLVQNGPVEGTPIESPDFGYLTQLWVGDEHATFCELEQITPFLLPDDHGWCGSTIYLEAIRTGSAPP